MQFEYESMIHIREDGSDALGNAQICSLKERRVEVIVLDDDSECQSCVNTLSPNMNINMHEEGKEKYIRLREGKRQTNK